MQIYYKVKNGQKLASIAKIFQFKKFICLFILIWTFKRSIYRGFKNFG